MSTHSPRRIRRIITLAAYLAFAAPVAGAQGERVADNRSQRDNARADELEAQVEGLLQQKSSWGKAARLQQRAATLRGDDPRAVRSLRLAAFYHEAIGRRTEARILMERAASCAETFGEVALQAESLIDAAFIAIEERRPDLVPGYVRQARRLAASSHLQPEVRAALAARLGDPPTTRGVAVATP
jgi:hypothetical protein